MTSQYPFEIHDLSQDEKTLAAEVCSSGVRVGPKGYYFPENFREYGPKFYNFSVRSNDVWLTGFPRSGTTLISEMAWLIGNDLNYEEAAKTVVDQRFAFLDKELFEDASPSEKCNQEADRIIKDYRKNYLDYQEQRSDQRFIKTHLPLSICPANLFSSGAKVIYCARQPKDVIVSSYKLVQLFGDIDESSPFSTTWEAFKGNIGGYLPYFEHVKEGWSKRHEPNFMFLFYEDVVKDKRGTIIKVADFLGKKLTEPDIQKLEDHLSLENFKKNASVNNEHYVKAGYFKSSEDNTFIRKGQTGGWRNYFVGSLEKEVNEWIQHNLKGTDLVFPEK